LLAILERQVREAGGVYLFCDTDSMAIVAKRKSRLVRLTDPESGKQHKVKAISWRKVENIIAKIEPLNPYSFPGLLKVEHKSLKRQIYGFGVSAKRYCLFDENYGIVHASSHGLGHLYVPSSKWIKKLEVREWVKEAWEHIIKNDPHAKLPSWFSHPAMMRIAMTTPKVQMWKVIEKHQSDLPYRDQFKPSNFVLSPIIAKLGDEDHQDGFPKGVKHKDFMLVTPFNSNSKNWYGSRYINVHGGGQFTLAPLERKKDSEASPHTLEHVVRMHTNHAESKSLAPDGNPCNFLTRGLLQRTPITAVGKPRIVGKESDRRWEQEEDPSLFEPTLVEYRENETARITTDVKLQNKIRNSGFSIRELAERIGLNPSTIQNARNGKRIRKSSAGKIWHFLKKALAPKSRKC
jgi:lambda repressor-like predicted transcriptional regulator